MKGLVLGCAFLALSAASQRVVPQSAAANPPGVVLDLTMEVATTDHGLPAALRFTLTNIGNVAVEIPVPAIDCLSSNGSIRIKTVIHFDGPAGSAGGHGCGGGMDYQGSLLDIIRKQWFHLRPGEYLSFTGDARTMIDRADKPATYEYWAVYDPPELSQGERAIVAQSGLIIPSAAVESNTLEFHMP